MKKRKYYFTEAEWRYIVYSLNELRSKLIAEGKFTDTVDDTIAKVMKAKVKKVKVV